MPLSDLHWRVLRALGSLEPPPTLGGGGALIGFHGHDRATEDLDLFFHGLRQLDHIPRDVEAMLAAAGLTVERLHRGPAFQRLRVGDDHDRLTVDLVAEPVPNVHPPELRDGILVETRQELLINKLCALLSRTELRDLEDVRVLVDRGADLDAALASAPTKDGGFSPTTLAWLLDQFPLHLSDALGFDEATLRTFRDALVERLVGSHAGP